MCSVPRAELCYGGTTRVELAHNNEELSVSALQSPGVNTGDVTAAASWPQLRSQDEHSKAGVARVSQNL